MKKKLSTTKLFYGIGNIAYSTVSQTEANFVMYFGTAILGLPGMLMGVIVAVSVFWDAISDPIIGHISDSTRNSIFGKRHGYILLGTIGMAVCNLFLWQISPAWGEMAKAITVCLMILLLETFNTCFASPHGALGIEISSDSFDRTKTMSIKVVFFLLGMLLPSVILLLSSNKAAIDGQISAEQLIHMGYIISIVCFVCGLVCFFGTLKFARKSAMIQSTLKEKPKKLSSVLSGFFSVFASREKRAVILGYSTSQLSSVFLTASGLHMFTFSFHYSSTQISVLMLFLFLTAILSQPFWLHKSKIKGKLPTLLNATRLAIVGTLLLALVFVFSREISSLSFVFSLCAICVCGFGIGALFSLPIALYSDIIVAEHAKEESSATQLGFLNLAFKFANAIGLVFIGALLDLVKFNPSMPVQPIEVQNRLAIIVISGIALSFVVSIFLYKSALPKSNILSTNLSLRKRGKLNEVQTN